MNRTTAGTSARATSGNGLSSRQRDVSRSEYESRRNGWSSERGLRGRPSRGPMARPSWARPPARPSARLREDDELRGLRGALEGDPCDVEAWREPALVVVPSVPADVRLAGWVTPAEH